MNLKKHFQIYNQLFKKNILETFTQKEPISAGTTTVNSFMAACAFSDNSHHESTP